MEEHNTYNDEEVCYCADCLSLRVVTVDDMCYCDKCGSTNILSGSIFDWSNLYEKRKGHKYLNYKNNGREQKERGF